MNRKDCELGYVVGGCLFRHAGRDAGRNELQMKANLFFFTGSQHRPSRERFVSNSKWNYNRNSSLCGKNAAFAGSRTKQRVA